MTSDPGAESVKFFAEDFPALQDFLGAYFHEDFMDEYDSPEAATKQFCEDAAPEEVKQTLHEWRSLYAQLKGRPLTEWQAALRKAGRCVANCLFGRYSSCRRNSGQARQEIIVPEFCPEPAFPFAAPQQHNYNPHTHALIFRHQNWTL